MAARIDTRQILIAAMVATIAAVAPAQASAGPKLVKGTAVDSDSDGSVDAFDLSFSAKVKGKAQRRGFSFKVAGYRVTRVGAPRGRRVRVSVAELPGCDLGARPVVSFRPKGKSALTDSRKRSLRGSRIDLGKRVRGAPRLTCAVTADRDDDGRLDAVVLTYSRRVRNRRLTGAAVPFTVNRYVVTSMEKAKARTITLRLRERAGFDTGEVPAVIYTRPKGKRNAVTAAVRKGRRAGSVTFNDTRDRVLPRLVAARTADADTDGRLDTVTARFSEAVRAHSSAPAVSGARVSSAAQSGRDGIAARLAEGAVTTSTRPTISFRAGRVRDLPGNSAGALSARAADGAAPVIVAARTSDRGGVTGRLDTLSLTFSESVNHGADSDGRYPFGVTGYSVAAAAAAGGTSMSLALNESSTTDTASRPPVGYTRGVGTPVRDASGNEAATQVFTGVSDGIFPRLLSVVTDDADADGKLDGVIYNFSEPVLHPDRACPGCGFTLTGSPAAVRAGAAAGASMRVSITEGAANSGLRPIASYSPVAGATVVDTSGNQAPAATLQAADGAAPVALSAETADADSNARIDRVNMTFSEPLSYAGDAAGAISLKASGYAVSSVDASSSTALSVHLTERAAADTGSAPAISYDGASVPLLDANGTQHANRSYPNLTRDAVAPRFVDATTADDDGLPADVPGKIDAVELHYSEEVVGTPVKADFTVPGRTVNSITFAPDAVQIQLDEGASFDTDATPLVSYSPSTSNLHDVPEGTGDTADAAPGASTQAADGAPPAVVAARTEDDDTNGKIDRVPITFSEPIDYVPQSVPAITLSGLVVAAVTVTGPATIDAAVTESGAPNGGTRPAVAVSVPERVTDKATPPNNARTTAFTGTEDGVRPALLGATYGEVNASACDSGAVNGRIDCLRATWSETVEPAGSLAPFDAGSRTLTGQLIPPSPTSTTDLTFNEGSAPDRDNNGTLVYADGPGRVTDLAGNPALDDSTSVSRACADGSGTEQNDAFAMTNPLLDDPPPLQTLCAADEDWFKVNPAPAETQLAVDPADTLTTRVELYNSASQLVAGPTAAGNLGQLDILDLPAGAGPYWLRVYAPAPQEGDYCVDLGYRAGDVCDDGDFNPN